MSNKSYNLVKINSYKVKFVYIILLEGFIVKIISGYPFSFLAKIKGILSDIIEKVEI